MNSQKLADKAHSQLDFLCGVKPNRRTGSEGNKVAVEYAASHFQSLGYEVDTTGFDVLDYIDEGSSLSSSSEDFEIYTSPYSLGCDTKGELLPAQTVEQLNSLDCRGSLLLLRDEICLEQLMPKNFVFYNPEHHQQIIALLEEKAPAGIISATKGSPDQVGALDPFPLVVDGDFNIPIAYCTDKEGQRLARHAGQELKLRINAQRIPSSSSNVIARLQPESSHKLIFTAHIDAYEDSPGASDNASGVVVLLLLAELLATFDGDYEIEFALLNGEDHYSAAGQMDYLRRYGNELSRTSLAINIDDVGYKHGRSSYSFYECEEGVSDLIRNELRDFDDLVEGPQWFNGDHMIFVQNGVPCMAFTAEKMPELMSTVTHTKQDTPDILNVGKLINLAEALNRVTRSM